MLKTFSLIIVTLATIVIGFQNCAGPFEVPHQANVEATNQILLSISASAPLPVQTLASFGAKGDGVTDDTAALRKAFKTLGVMLDGESKSYKVNGTLESIQDLNLKNATLIQIAKSYTTRTILAHGTTSAKIKISLTNVVIDLRGDETMGSMDSAGIWIAYAQPTLQNIEVKGTLGKGFGIMVVESVNAVLSDINVHDLTWQPYAQDKKLVWADHKQNWGSGTTQSILYYKGKDSTGNPIFQLDRLNEQLVGIMITMSTGVTITRPKVSRLQARFDDGSVYPYQTDAIDVASGAKDVKISGAILSYTWEGVDTAGVPSTNISISDSQASDIHGFGFKFANSVNGFEIKNSTGTRCGISCFVVSGLSSPSSDSGSNNGWFINIKSIDSGVGPGNQNLWGTLATRAGLRVLNSSFSNPSKIRIVNSQFQSSYINNAVHSEVANEVTVSDLNTSQQNYQTKTAATSWSKIASMFTSVAGRAPTMAEQKSWFLKGVDSGLTTSQIQSQLQSTFGSTTTPTPTPTTPTPTPTTAGTCSFAGRTIANGSAVIAYQQGGLPSGYNCNASSFYQIRVCSNGILSGTYTNGICSVSGSSGTACSFAGRSIPHGNATIAYQQGSLPMGYNCNALPNYQIRTCSNGVLSGSYLQATCKIQ